MNRRRPLALLFTDISRSTALSASLEPEDYADLLADLRAAVAANVEQQKGIVVRIDGDGALCAFGYPHALESAGKHAAQCALAIHAAAEAIARRRKLPNLALHSGIHAGLVLVSEGDLVRGRIEVLGDATNIAARLRDAAGQGEILISSHALAQNADAFELGDRHMVSLPGMKRPLEVHLVRTTKERVLASHAIQSSGRGQFIGRAAELDAVADWLDSAAGPRSCMISGEPGSGKSRLLQAAETLAVAAGWSVFHGHCQSDYVTAPLQPMIAIAAQIGHWQRGNGDDATLFAALKSDLLARTDAGRVLLIMDDWQWADDATRRLIEQLLLDSGGALRVLLSSREMHSAELVTYERMRMALSPLSRQDCAQMVLGLVPHADPQRVRQIHALANGNPLMIEELCRDPDMSLSQAEQVRPSFRIATLVQQRLALLAPAVADVLELCAVIGVRIPLSLLHELAGHAAIDARQVLIADEFLAPDGEEGYVRFRHILVREAIYDQLSPKHRRSLHFAIATNMLGQKDARKDWGFTEQLAHHLLASDDANGLDYARQAGDAAMLAGSLDKAQHQFRHMAEFVRRNPISREAKIMAGIGNRLGASALPDPHPEHFGPLQGLLDIAESAQLPAVAARIQYWLAALHHATGNPQEASRLLRAESFERNFASSGLPPEMINGLHGQIAILSLRHRKARPILDAAIAGLSAYESSAYDYSLAYIHGMRAQMRGEQGDFVGAQQDFGRVEYLLKGEQPPLYGAILTQKAGVALWANEWDRCRQFAEEGIAHGDAVGSRYTVIVSRALFAYASILQEGPEPRHLATLHDAGHWFEEAQCRFTQSLVQSWFADGALRAGRRDDAARAARACMALGSIGLRSGQALAARVLAQLADDAKAANGHLRRAYALARRMDSPREWAATRLVHDSVLALRPDMPAGAMALPMDNLAPLWDAPTVRHAANG